MAKRQKAKAFSFQGFDAAHYKTTTAYTRAVNALFDKATSDIAEVAHKETYNPDKPFDFDDYPKAKAQLQKVVKGLASNMQAVIETGSRRQWLFACHKNDEFIASIIDTTKLTKGRLQKMQDRNLDALQSFQARKVGGMSLAERVWKYTEQYKAQIELGLDVGLGEGRSAQQLSRDLRQNLQDPNRLFRRVRDKRGNLQLSKAAKAFHPGQGVYRSSYKNAMRLTRSEINMAYREADHLRWQQLDFVVGFEVHRSNHEPKCKCDLCERLVGKYPKYFKFKGWHPQCLCYATAILMDEDDFDKQELSDLKSALKGTEYRKLSAKNEVTELPDGFKDWVAENETKQANWASTPYFIKDNFIDGMLSKGVKFTPSDFKPAQDTIAPTKVEVPKQDDSFDYSKRNEALDAYISGDAMWLNNYLRGRGDFGEISREEQKMLDELTAVTKLAKVGERTLWRSVDARAIFGDMTDGEFEDLAGRLLYGDNTKFVMERTQRFMDVVGKEITEKGFMSTTKSKEVATEWGDYSGSRTPVLMKIRTTANTRGVDVEKYTLAHNPEVEQSQAQKEILLRRGQRYKVVGIKELDGQICVEVELIDDEKGVQTKQDPFMEAIDAMQADISNARTLATEWGIKSTDIDTAIQRRDVTAVKVAIMMIKQEASRVSREYAAYMSDASKTISEAKAAGVDAKAVQSDVNVLVNKSIWNAGKSGYNQRLQQLKDAIIQSLVIVHSVRSAEQQKNEAKVAALLGVKQGEDMTFEEANDLRGNPNFERKFVPDPNGRYVDKNGERFSKNGKYKKKYTVNCQSCVVANELRRRGMDVEALGNTKERESTPYILSTHTELAWLDDNGNTPKSERTYGFDYHATMTNLNTLTEAVGRYHIKWQWSRGGGHIITCERLADGTLRIYDPQTGKVITDFEAYTKPVNLRDGIEVLRVDTLQINTDIIAGVVTKTKTKAKAKKTKK